MGIHENYETLEDFILRAKQTGIKTIFFNMTQTQTSVKLQAAGTEVDGNRVKSFVALNAITDSNDGKYPMGKLVITHQKQVAEILIGPATTQDEINAFLKASKDALQNGYIAEIQSKYESADLKAGSCAPTVG